MDQKHLDTLATFSRLNDGGFRCNAAQANALAEAILAMLAENAALKAARTETEANLNTAIKTIGAIS